MTRYLFLSRRRRIALAIKDAAVVSAVVAVMFFSIGYLIGVR